MSESDALLLGRKTWQGHDAAVEPMPDGASFGDVMQAIRKYVVSTTLTDVSACRNSTLIKENVLEQVRALKARPGKHILIDGSSVLVHTQAQNNLVDEYSLFVFLLVLCGGKKVFPDGLQAGLHQAQTRPFPTGVVLLRYAVEHPSAEHALGSNWGTKIGGHIETSDCFSLYQPGRHDVRSTGGYRLECAVLR